MSIWQDEISLSLLQERSVGTLAEYLDIRFLEIGDDYLKADMPVDHRTIQPLGLLNGGASCALAETVGSTAANFCVNRSTHYCVGLDINANHLRGVTEGRVLSTARPIHLGEKTQVWEILIENTHHKRICVARLTMMVLKKDHV